MASSIRLSVPRVVNVSLMHEEGKIRENRILMFDTNFPRVLPTSSSWTFFFIKYLSLKKSKQMTWQFVNAFHYP